MANELTLSASFQYVKGAVSEGVDVENVSVTVTGTPIAHRIQNIGITEEAIDIGDVVSGGYMFCRNLDLTNVIKLRPATAVADMIRIDPGGKQFAIFRLDDGATAPFAIALVAACDLEFILLSD